MLQTIVSLRKLKFSKKVSGGRNNTGQITVRFKRSPQFKSFNVFVDNRRQFLNCSALVLASKRRLLTNSQVSLLYFPSFGLFSYILASSENNRNKKILFLEKYKNTNVLEGSSCILSEAPLSSFIFNIEVRKFTGGQFCKSAGAKARLVRKFTKNSNNEIYFVGVLLPSGKLKYFLEECICSLGRVSGNLKPDYKAGNRMRIGARPRVRGVAMNPVDHPHGGGEGRTSGGRPSVSKWGLSTKGLKTKKQKIAKREARFKSRVEARRVLI